MANLNKVLLIGRLTRDPEVRTFAGGGKVAAFGFAVNNRKKNQATGQWEEEPVFIDIEGFNRGETGRQLADLIEQNFRKGRQFFIEGHLRFDQWTGQDGSKRQKLKVVMDNFQFLEPRGENMPGDSGGRPMRAASPGGRQDSGPAPSYGASFGSSEDDSPGPVGQGGDDGIPF